MGAATILSLHLSITEVDSALACALVGALTSALVGLALSRLFKAWVLIPATAAFWIVAAALGFVAGTGLKASGLAALFAGVCLQIGYVAGSLLIQRPDARQMNGSADRLNDATTGQKVSTSRLFRRER